MTSVSAGSTLWRAPRPSPSTRRTVKTASVRIAQRGLSARALVAAVAEAEEACALLGAHVSRPQVHVLERPPSRREPPEPHAEVRDGVAHRVVVAGGAGQEEHAALDSDVEAAVGQERRELVGALVDLDHEPVRAAAEVGERACVHDHAALDDHDRVADPLHLLEVVGRDDDVHAELGADAADEVEHLRPLHGVEPVGRLVEEHELRVVRDRRRRA